MARPAADDRRPGLRRRGRAAHARLHPHAPRHLRRAGEHVQDFEEYAHLYGETWGDPLIRWLLSTVPVATPFDDHDVHDDWNTSQAWVDELRKKPCRAGVPDPPLDWAVTDGPLFDNQVGIVEIAGRTARVGVERTTGADWRRPALTTSLDPRLV